MMVSEEYWIRQSRKLTFNEASSQPPPRFPGERERVPVPLAAVSCPACDDVMGHGQVGSQIMRAGRYYQALDVRDASSYRLRRLPGE